MIRYGKYQSNSALEGVNGKWYLRVKNGEQISLSDLAAHMASHNTPYSKGAITGILTDMVNCIKEILLDGKTVKLADLAIFSIGIHSKGANTAEEATVQNIRSISFNARSTGELSVQKLSGEIKFKELDTYNVESDTQTNENGD